MATLGPVSEPAREPEVREIPVRRRRPEEVRARLLGPGSPLPPDLARALADELAEIEEAPDA